MSASMFSFWLLAIPTALAAGRTPFLLQVVPTIGSKITNENCVCSPVSVRNLLAMLYLGANGPTAHELKTVLQFHDTKQDVAITFGEMFPPIKKPNVILTVGDRFYVDKGLNLTDKFRKLAEAFHANILVMQFLETAIKNKEINSWVEQQTENKIHELISVNSSFKIGAVFVNEIYFKAKWLNPFPRNRTHTVNNNETHKKFDMMVQDKVMLYAVLHDLNADVAQLKMQDTNISMLVMQPREAAGLAELEEKLKSIDLTRLTRNMTAVNVTLMVPKFRIEFDTPLKPALRQLGLKILFRRADFSNLLADGRQLDVSEIRHKSVIEVTEEGVEAAGGTGMEVRPPSLYHNYTANRQFFFAIIDEENVYFAGHVANM